MTKATFSQQAPLILLIVLLGWVSVTSAQPHTTVIGVVVDGPWERNDEILGLFVDETLALTSGEFAVSFPDGKRRTADWSISGIRNALDQLLQDPDVDIVLTMGVVSSQLAATHGKLPKPVIAPFIIDQKLQDVPLADGHSGTANLCYMIWPDGIKRDLDAFHEITPFRHLTFLCNNVYAEAIPGLVQKLQAECADQGFDVNVVYTRASADSTLRAIPADADAVYMTPLVRLGAGQFDNLVRGFITRRLPSFSMLGREDVQRGVLGGLTNLSSFQRLARRAALNIQGILLGDDPAQMPVAVNRDERLTINMGTARAIGVSPSWAVLTEADVIDTEREEVARQLTLAEAVEEAVAANLDLKAADYAVRAGAQEVKAAWARLLPQVDASALGLLIDEDRAAAARGTAPEKSLTGSLTLEQILFSEPAWANVSIRKDIQQGREWDRQQREVDLAQAAATAYLNVLRAKTLERIQRDNLRLTRSNLEMAQVRNVIGAGNPAEVYRWQSQIASSRKSVIEANAQRNLAEMGLNRLLHRPMEESFGTSEIGLDDPLLISSDERFFRFFGDPETFRDFRAFMAEDAKTNAPEMQQFRYSIAAQERYLKSATWSFWSPSVAVQGQLDKEFSRSGAGSSYLTTPGTSAPNDVDWNVGLRISLPLFEGGRRVASRRQSREELSRLETARDATAERVSQRVRSALHVAGASHAGIGLSRDAANAAHRNLTLVSDAYGRGTVSILELLDAQNAALVADLVAANAVYDFLIDLMEVERAAGRLDFFTTPAERESWFERASAYIDEHRADQINGR